MSAAVDAVAEVEAEAGAGGRRSAGAVVGMEMEYPPAKAAGGGARRGL